MLQKSIQRNRIKPFYDEWAILDKELREIFTLRKIDAAATMNRAIHLYKDLLDQCSTADESVFPLNNSERLGFIEGNRSTFAAYRQLQELFKEMEKKLAAKRAMIEKPNQSQ